MPIAYQKWITRADLRNNPKRFYVFGDNVARQGYGGQAREMRGEPNAIGVVTKWAPDMQPGSFFTDCPDIHAMVECDLHNVELHLKGGHTVVIPEDGIGTGLSQLPARAPKLNAYIEEQLKRMGAAYGGASHD